MQLQLGYGGDKTIAAGLQALTYLPASDLHLRSWVSMILGCAYFASKGDMPQAESMLQQALSLAEKANDVFTLMMALTFLSRTYIICGKLRQANATCERLLQYAAEPRWAGQPAAGYALLNRSVIRYEQNDIQGTMEDITEGHEGIQGHWLKRMSMYYYFMMARLKRLQGNENEARQLMHQGMEIIKAANIKQTFIPIGA